MSKAPRRKKGESGPASSGAFVGKVGGDPFAAFASFGGGATGGEAAVPPALSPEFVQAFKKITKRDNMTKVAAANEIEQLIEQASEEQLTSHVIGEVAQILRRRYYSRDKVLRRALCRCVQRLFDKGKTAKKKCVPHLPVLLPPWMVLRCDGEPEVAAAAATAWEAAFDTEQRGRNAVVLCRRTLIPLLLGGLAVTPAVVQEEEGLKPQEAAEVAENLHASLLLACKLLLETCTVAVEGGDAAGEAVSLLTQEALAKKRLWSAGGSQFPRVRMAAYQLITAFLQLQPDALDPFEGDLSGFMQNAFGEKADEVHGVMWPAVLLWMQRYREALHRVKNVHVAVFQKLFAMLRRTSGMHGAKATYRSLLPFLALLRCEELLGNDWTGFIDGLLSSLWSGMQSNSLPMYDVPLLLEVWTECWCFLVDRSPNPGHLVSSHLAPALRQTLFQIFRLPREDRRHPAAFLASALRKAEAIAALHAPLLAFWTELFADVEKRSYTVYPSGIGGGAVTTTSKKKPSALPKGGGGASGGYGFGETVQGSAVVLERLAGIFQAVGDAAPSDGGYRCEVAVYFGTFLFNEVKRWEATPEAVPDASPDEDVEAALTACWDQCAWDVVPGFLKKAYDTQLKPALLRRLSAAKKVKPTAREPAVHRLATLLRLVRRYVSGDEAAGLLREAGGCGCPWAAQVVVQGLSLDKMGLQAVCEAVGGFAEAAAGEGGALLWGPVVMRALQAAAQLGSDASAASAESVLRVLVPALEEGGNLPLLSVACKVAKLSEAWRHPALTPLWHRLARLVIPSLLSHQDHHVLTPLSQDILEDWSHAVSACPPPDVLADSISAVARNLSDAVPSPGSPALLQARMLTLPCCSCGAALKGLQAVMESLWDEGEERPVGAEHCSAMLLDGVSVLQGERDGHERWKRVVDVLARVVVAAEELPEEAGWVLLHLARGRLVAPGAVGVLCEAALHHYLAAAGNVAELAREVVTQLSASGPLLTIAPRINIVRALSSYTAARAATLTRCLLDTNCIGSFHLVLAQTAISAKEGDEGERHTLSFMKELLMWCRRIAERDEIEGDVSDEEVVTALKVVQWVGVHCPELEVAEVVGALYLAASEKLLETMPEQPWELRTKLELFLALTKQQGEHNIPSISDLATSLAGLLQGYCPCLPDSWAVGGGAPPLPVSGCFLQSFSHLLEALVRDPDTGTGEKSLLLTVAIDLLLYRSAETVSEVGFPDFALSQTVVSLLCSPQLKDVRQILMEQWGDVLYNRCLTATEALVAAMQQKPAQEISSGPATFTEHFDVHTSPEYLLCTLAGCLAEVKVEELEQGGCLPAKVLRCIRALADLGDILVRGSLSLTSQNTQRGLLQLSGYLSQPCLSKVLHFYFVEWSILLDLVEYHVEERSGTDTPMKSCLVEEIKKTTPRASEGEQPAFMLKHVMNIVGAMLMTSQADVTAALSHSFEEEYDDEEGDGESTTSRIPTDVKTSLLSMVPLGGISAVSTSTESFLPQDLSRNATFLCRFWSRGDRALASVLLLDKLLSSIPASPRRWVTDCDPLLKDFVTNFIQCYLSPALVKRELDYVVSKGGGSNTFSPTPEFTVKVQPAAATILLEYEYEQVVTVKMVIPPSFPLNSLQHPDAQQIRARAGLREDVYRRWLLQITAKLLNKSARVWDCIVMWQKNLTQHFDGQDACPICYTVVNYSTQQLPSMVCSCCKGKYHKLCLYKWFKQSNNSTCPLCRSAWYSGAPSASSST